MNYPLLRLEDVHVQVDEREVLRGVDLSVEAGEIHVLLGPNGSGKSTLLKAIVSMPGYRVTKGRIIFDGQDLMDLRPYEKARIGIALMHQHLRPLSVKFSSLATELCKMFGSSLDLISDLQVNGLMERELFRGFSGGEAKRAELALVLLQRPRLALLDEPDSGVDLEGLKTVGKSINALIDIGASILLVTHAGLITEHLRRVDVAHVMIDGRIVESGDLTHILDTIKRKGYGVFRGDGI
ncbi:MAG: ATP-binding cassette domain-containing protein [Thermofilaceae archaeon]